MARADLEAAAEKYPDTRDGEFVGDGSRARERAAYIQGRLDALPDEVPGDAVIETMAREVDSHGVFERVHEGVWREHWCWCDSGEDWSPEHVARAVYAALRGAMQ